jgi:hypothetical protein
MRSMQVVGGRSARVCELGRDPRAHQVVEDGVGVASVRAHCAKLPAFKRSEEVWLM